MYHLVRYLGEHFDLDLVAPASRGVEEAENLLAKVCSDMEFVSPSPGVTMRRILRVGPYEKDPALATVIRRRLETKNYAAVQVEKPAMLPYLPKDLRIPIILDTWAYGLAGPLRALRYEAGFLTRARIVLQIIRNSMFDAFCWPDTLCILVVSEEDRIRCQHARPGRKVLVVPNGIDCSAVRPGTPRKEGPPVILFTGDMGFSPNVDAALFLACRIFPEIRRVHPNAELHLVGRNPDPRLQCLVGSSSGITVTGAVEDMVPYLHTATVYVAPHFTGAGTRTKVLEAMAAGLAIVTTSIGIEGIEASPDQEVVIANDLPSLVAAALHLLGNPQERILLGTAARRLMEERYDWSRCLAPLDTLYAGLLPKKVVTC